MTSRLRAPTSVQRSLSNFLGGRPQGESQESAVTNLYGIEY